MAYGFDLGEITALAEYTGNLVVTLDDGTTPRTDTLYYSIGHGWRNPARDIYLTVNESEHYLITMVNFTETDVGEEYNINLSTEPAPTETFTNAISIVRGERIVWEGDVDETPQEISLDILNGISPITCYSNMDGIDSVLTSSEYDDETNKFIFIFSYAAHAVEIVMIPNSEGTAYLIQSIAGQHHVKIIAQSQDKAILITASQIGSSTFQIDCPYSELEKATSTQYLLYLSLSGMTTPISCGRHSPQNPKWFEARLYDGTHYMAWVIDNNTDIITGTFTANA